MNDLQQFLGTYLAECYELLGEMEEKLLNLTPETANSEILNAIFRCAHSIKGGAGAFGLSRITAFTHVLEFLLDDMRNGRIQPHTHVVDALLRAKDIVLAMITCVRDQQPIPQEMGEEVLKELERLRGGEPATLSAASSAHPSVTTTAAATGKQRFIIRFTPRETMLMSGNEPLLLIRELKRLGKAEIKTDISRLPDLHSIHPQKAYFSWEITLETDHAESAIREVFEFVEDECILEIQPLVEEEAVPTLTEKATEPKSEHSAVSPALPVGTVSAAASNLGGASNSAPAASNAAITTTNSIRVDIDKVDRLINLAGEVVITQSMVAALALKQQLELPPELVQGISELSQHTRELQEAVMAIRMQPVKSIFSRMPRLVRDLSQKLGKQVVLNMHGEETEVDKTIIEQLSDPLTHMIRNSIDHGIESPESRLAKGKSAQGTIELSAQHRGGKIIIEIRDDGQGINRERVYQKAQERQLIPAGIAMSDEEIDQLIFMPGFSTAETVSDVSGRGVGMDVVKKNIDAINGSVSVENRPGKGANFIISLPLTLAILDGMVVRIGHEYYILPINNIIETLRPKAADLRILPDGPQILNLRGHVLPIVRLAKVFGITGAEHDASKALVVIVEAGTHRMGLVVDELVGQQQVVIKSIESNTRHIPGISGATILGDGKVSLIIDVSDLHRFYGHASPAFTSHLETA
jgi:two-component system chemotaxis sensor kinase CheA